MIVMIVLYKRFVATKNGVLGQAQCKQMMNRTIILYYREKAPHLRILGPMR